MKQFFKLITLCILLSMFLLNGCGKQPSEEADPTDTQPAAQTTQSRTESTGDLEEGELPALTIPWQTEPMTQPTEGTPAPETNQPTEGTKPPAATEPTEGTEPSEPTQPPEATAPPETEQPTEPTEPHRLDEDELPPIPVG